MPSVNHEYHYQLSLKNHVSKYDLG